MMANPGRPTPAYSTANGSEPNPPIPLPSCPGTVSSERDVFTTPCLQSGACILKRDSSISVRATTSRAVLKAAVTIRHRWPSAGTRLADAEQGPCFRAAPGQFQSDGRSVLEKAECGGTVLHGRRFRRGYGCDADDRTRAFDDLRPLLAPGAIGIVGDISNGTNQQRFIADSRFFTEPLVTPSKNLLDVSFGGWSDEVSGHRAKCPRRKLLSDRPVDRFGRSTP